MKCQGVGQEPRVLYKTIHHYQLRNGKPWYHSGRGLCAQCGGVYAVRPLKDNKAGLVYHKRLGDCSERTQREQERVREYWVGYSRMNHVTGAPTGVFGGQIGQFFNVVEQPAYVNYNTTMSVTQTYSATQAFRVEARSNTMNDRGQYVFNINDQIYVNPTDRMTIVVDYASWNSWNQSITVSNYARIEADRNWFNWTQPTQAIQGYTYADVNRVARQQLRREMAYTAPRQDPAVLAERRQREAEALFQRVEAERRAKSEAVANAHETLLSLLTPEQREEYQTRKQFHIRGSKGTLYRIMHGSSGNVRQVLSEADEGRGLHAFCAHPRMSVDRATAEAAGITAGHLPHEDAMIAQMLQLQVDEDSFLAVANRHW